MRSEKGKISLFTAILMNINVMVGAAIYINPPLMTQQVGQVSYLTWLFGALIFLPVVLGVTSLSSLFPQEGGFFNYAKKGLGPFVGFLTGWMYFLSYTGVAAVQESALRHILVEKFHLSWAADYPHLFNFLFFMAICFLSSLHLQAVGNILNLCTLIKLMPLIIVCFLPLFLPHTPSSTLTFTPLDDPYFGLESLTLTLPFAIFGLWGFEACSSLSHRIKNNRGALAIIVGFIATSFIYTLFHFNLLTLMGPEELAQKKIEDFVHYLPYVPDFLLHNFSTFISLAIVIAYGVAIYGELSSCSFLLQAMAKEKLLFFEKYLSRNNRHEQPVYAIFTMGLMAFLFNLIIPKLTIMVALTNLGFCLAFITSLLSLAKIYRSQKKKSILPYLGLASSTLVGIYCFRALDKLSDVLFPVLLMLLGSLFYRWQLHLNSASGDAT